MPLAKEASYGRAAARLAALPFPNEHACALTPRVWMKSKEVKQPGRVACKNIGPVRTQCKSVCIHHTIDVLVGPLADARLRWRYP